MGIFGSFTLFALLVIIYQFIVSIFTVLFRFTGMPREKARFQVVALLTGCGFTTKESEMAISTPVRRKLSHIIMVFGYAFSVTIMSALVNVFVSLNQFELQHVWWQLSIPLVLLLVVEMLGRNKTASRFINKRIEAVAEKLVHGNYENRILLLDHIGHNAIVEVNLRKVPEEFSNKMLRDSCIGDKYGILVILLERAGRQPDKVHAEDYFREGDRLIVCGKYQNICKALGGGERALSANT
ncbi:MAG: hypothetical protein R3Y63_03555 [Eubacteriales bacterium]